jgi:hypothetical protein
MHDNHRVELPVPDSLEHRTVGDELSTLFIPDEFIYISIAAYNVTCVRAEKHGNVGLRVRVTEKREHGKGQEHISETISPNDKDSADIGQSCGAPTCTIFKKYTSNRTEKQFEAAMNGGMVCRVLLRLRVGGFQNRRGGTTG